MSTRPWEKSTDVAEQSRSSRGECLNAVVLIVLLVVAAVVAVVIIAPAGQWEHLNRNLPDLWEVLRALLHGETLKHELAPLVSPSPPSPTPIAIP
jgi:flagellar basal body-associated protein FliL